MPALGPSVDEFNERLARADGLKAEPDQKLGGAVNLVRPTLADAERLHAAQRATAGQRASFETFTAQHGLNARSLDAGLLLLYFASPLLNGLVDATVLLALY
jgi:hypothetical protein